MSANPYDPVTTTDSTHLSDDEWGLNLPRIRYKAYGPSRIKGFCNFLKERARIFIIIGCILVLGIILISIIAVTTQKSPGRKPSNKDKEKMWSAPKEGLTFYPVPKDGSTIISFTGNIDEDSQLLESLSNVTDAYVHQNQFDKEYMECTENTKPPNRTCKLTDIHFGDECTRHKGWGYHNTMPCIFLQLNLPENMVIEPILPESLLWPVAKIVMEDYNDTSYVPVHCQGTTEEDRKILGVLGSDKFDSHPIQYFPKDGFASYFYRPRNMSLPFIKPAMMIRLTSLRDSHMVHITCTVWGQLFNYLGMMVDHELLKTSFGVYLH